MTSPNDPQDPKQSTLAQLTQTVQDLQAQTELGALTDEVKRLDSLCAHLTETLQRQVAARQYAFLAPLQAQVQQATTRWGALEPELLSVLQPVAPKLKQAAQSLGEQLNQAAIRIHSDADFQRLSTLLDANAKTLSSYLEETEQAFRARYETFEQALQELDAYLTDVSWALEQVQEAELTLESGESVFIACKAEWVDGRNNPEGVLYLTNQRLFFEQKETKGKFLGLFGGKQVQDALWSVTLAQITGMDSQRKGIIGGKAMLTLSLSNASHAELELEIKGGFGNERLADLIQRVRAGEYNAPVTLPELASLPSLKVQPVPTLSQASDAVASSFMQKAVGAAGMAASVTTEEPAKPVSSMGEAFMKKAVSAAGAADEEKPASVADSFMKKALSAAEDEDKPASVASSFMKKALSAAEDEDKPASVASSFMKKALDKADESDKD